ncbi:4-(cytidine 5'-diphospho)-2-C-methyl-D-erythritol kinase [Clostridium sp. BJN0001]|uniref:4-(cytidine 5'-diphospho)-2-C-methyl-D-erythritol kinase n=1 Tax=Clostridium sp. BJN0001 TaxID=2930219 RepID=UPI001FD188F4|nr:4-(cytidine 5'-diphospho)-2-C-methyl-D-erythritol kinase [Clostridium sp. BJN0001]
MDIKAYAKINIALDIVGKRDDGYHLLRMIMQTIDLYDVVSVSKAKSGIHVTCNKPYVPVDNRNLAYKAADIFLDKYKISSGVDINILKNIPVSAGLAGGSTDAAAVIKIMNKLFDINESSDNLKKLSLSLGADVPYCIEGGTALCEGIGEIITSLKPFKNRILVLVKPPFGVSTKEVYKKFDLSKVYNHPDIDEIINNMEKNQDGLVYKKMKNLLENVTLRKYKEISEIKIQAMNNDAEGTMMSGSGPTVFAFFDDMIKAQRFYNKMSCKYKEVYLTRTI